MIHPTNPEAEVDAYMKIDLNLDLSRESHMRAVKVHPTTPRTANEKANSRNTWKSRDRLRSKLSRAVYQVEDEDGQLDHFRIENQ